MAIRGHAVWCFVGQIYLSSDVLALDVDLFLRVVCPRPSSPAAEQQTQVGQFTPVANNVGVQPLDLPTLDEFIDQIELLLLVEVKAVIVYSELSIAKGVDRSAF